MIGQRMKSVLRQLSRNLIVASFVGMALWMIVNKTNQLERIETSLGVGQPKSGGILLIIVEGNLIGSAMIHFGFRVEMACLFLIGLFNLHSSLLGYLLDPLNVLWNLGVGGALILSSAESLADLENKTGDVDPAIVKKVRNVGKLIGRLLLLMAFFAVTTPLDSSFFVLYLVCNVLKFSVMVGRNTEICSAIMVVWMVVANFYVNISWNEPEDKTDRVLFNHSFFKCLSVIGGLLQLIVDGPGEYSADYEIKNRSNDDNSKKKSSEGDISNGDVSNKDISNGDATNKDISNKVTTEVDISKGGNSNTDGKKMEKMIETGLVYLIRLCLILPYIEQNRILLLETDWKKNGIPIGFGIFFFFAIKTLANAVSVEALWMVFYFVLIGHQSLSYLKWSFLLGACMIAEKSGVPEETDPKRKSTSSFLLAFCRSNLTAVFILQLHFDWTSNQIWTDLALVTLMAFLAVGFKARLAALGLAVWLAIHQVYTNAWWNLENDDSSAISAKHIFYQNCAVVAGLLLIALNGPGDFSIDEKRKLRN